MAGYVEKGRILTHELVGPSIWRMRLELPLIAKDAKPGQFIHVKVNDPTCILRRPISIAGTEPGKGILEIIYRIVGKGTEAMSHLKAGDVVDCLGPLWIKIISSVSAAASASRRSCSWQGKQSRAR